MCPLAYRFELLGIVGGGIARLDQRSSIVVDCTDDHAQREHVAQQAALGAALRFGCCRTYVRGGWEESGRGGREAHP